MGEQEALDKLTLYAKCSNMPTVEQIRTVNRYSNRLQKLIDRQEKFKPYMINIREKKPYYYCRKCKVKLLKSNKFCSNCGVEIDWRNK